MGVVAGALTGAGSMALMSHESKRDKGVLIGFLSGAVAGGASLLLILSTGALRKAGRQGEEGHPL